MNMRKRIVCFFIMVLIVFGFCETLAYSTSDYSIDIPSSYKKADGASFTSEDGTSIKIEELPFSGSSKGAFSEEFLDGIVKGLYSGVESTKEEMKKNIKEAYGDYLTDSQINEYVKSFKCDSIDKKEVTVATKNQYKCHHVIASFSTVNYSYFIEQYAFISNNKAYTLIIGASEKNKFQSDEVKNIINSFTITNYKDPEKEFSSILVIYIILTLISVALCVYSYMKKNIHAGIYVTVVILTIFEGLSLQTEIYEGTQLSDYPISYWIGFFWASILSIILSIIAVFKKKNSNEKIEKTEEKKEDRKEEQDAINSVNKKVCTKCGNEIDEQWDFCNNCGNKLKDEN